MKRLTKTEQNIVKQAIKALSTGGMTQFSCKALKYSGASPDLIERYQDFFELDERVRIWGITNADIGMYSNQSPFMAEISAQARHDLRLTMLMTFLEAHK